MWLLVLLGWLGVAVCFQERQPPTEQLCPEGWDSLQDGPCVPQSWNSTVACENRGAECSRLVSAVLNTTKKWLLVLQASDDKESTAAGNTLMHRYKQKWDAEANVVSQNVSAAGAALGEENVQALQQIIEQASQRGPIEQLDVSHSQCAEQTDVNHRRCFYNLVKVMQGEWVRRTSQAHEVVNTQNRYQGTMARAADYVMRKSGKDMQVDSYIMELMPNVNSQFFRPMRLLSESQYQAAAKRVRLHLVQPLEGSKSDVAKQTGLDESQVYFEPTLPVHPAFVEEKLPRPGEACEVVLHAQLPQEEAFLQGKEKVVRIEPEDTVTLVAFGSRPIGDTVQGYAEELVKLGPVMRKNDKVPTKGLHWIFIDTGDAEVKEQADIYNTSVSWAASFNTNQEEAGGRARYLPFTHQTQALRALKGRSDVIATFAANFPAGDLQALAQRGDARHIFIEVGGVDGLNLNAQKKIVQESWWEREAWERAAFSSMRAHEVRNYQYLAKKLDATLTTPQTVVDAWEDAGMKVGGHCPEIGACDTQLWNGQSACVESSPRCEAIAEKAMTSARSWTLLLTSSGGGGHMVAAGVLGRRQEREWRLSMGEAAAELEENRDLFTTRGYEGLRAVMTHGMQLAQPVVKIDLMSSPCTNLLGERGLGMGKAFSTVWNVGQSLGSVKALTEMSKAQHLEDDVFHMQCLHYMSQVIGGNRLSRHSPPSSVVSCQPMQHAAIAAAVDEVAKEAGSKLRLDIHLTETPTNQSVHYFNPLRSLTEKHPQAAARIRLHTISPVEGGAEAIATRTGLNVSQVVLEKNMPIDEALEAGSLPGPGEAVNISLKAHSRREEKFLGKPKKTFRIAAEDSLTLVMLGSQPTVTTMREYMNKFLVLKPRRQLPTATAKHWVFMAAGDTEQQQYEKLYGSLADEAERFNFLQQLTDGKLRIVPFTRQSVQRLESRADVTLTRSGGITSGELLALGQRGDKRQVLLHLEVPKDSAEVEPAAGSESRGQWERMALTEGMVPWEMGNALYLRRVLNATLVTPKILSSVW